MAKKTYRILREVSVFPNGFILETRYSDDLPEGVKRIRVDSSDGKSALDLIRRGCVI